MSLLVVADIVELTKIVVNDIHRRIEASKALKEDCHQLDNMVQQVGALVEGLPSTSAVKAGINATKALLDEIQTFVQTEIEFAQKSGCCSKFAKSTGHVAKIKSYEQRLHNQVNLLSSLVTVNSLSSSMQAVIENPDACKFWINAFGEADRRVPWPDFRDAVVSTTDCTSQMVDELRASLIVDSDEKRDEPLEKLVVSAVKFGKVFTNGTVESTVKSIAAHLVEKRRVWRISVRDRETKEELDIDAGFVMIPSNANLSTVRSEVIASAQDDDELSEDANFLKEVPGNFTFYLQSDKWSRVKKNQEASIIDRKIIDSVCLCPDPVASAPLTSAANMSAGNAQGAMKYKIDITPMQPEQAAEEDVAVVDKTVLVARGVSKESTSNWAGGLNFTDILQDPTLLHALRTICVQQGLNEENVEFMRRRQEAKNASASGGEKGMTSTVQWQEDFFGSNSPFELMLTEETKQSASLENVEEEIKIQLSAPLEELKAKLLKPPRTKLGSKTRIVIIGGGFAGAAAAIYCELKVPTCHVTLIDTKEYFEYTPMVLRAMAQKGIFKDIHINHKDYLSSASTMVLGKVIELNHDHCIMNANRQIVPFDYCLNFSGSSYYSEIKSDNASTAHRDKRFMAERHNIETAERILVIGGGLVGIELAADIKDAFPDLEVILIHSSTKLLKRMPGAHEIVLPFLRDTQGVTVRLNERVLPYSGRGNFETDVGGPSVPSEGTRAFWCTGYRPNTQHFRASKQFSSALDPLGFIIVEPTLLVKGTTNIFAGGDCICSTMFPNGERMAHYALFHSITVVKQLERLINEKRSIDDLIRYRVPKSDNPVSIMELGLKEAFVQAPAEYTPFWAMFGLLDEEKKLIPSPMADPAHERYCEGLRIGLMAASHIKVQLATGQIDKWRTPEGRKAHYEEEIGYCMLLQVWDDPLT
eukprot:GEMP01010232.1.p1 GENE.GEMP01010232.1~~GEMP01010232.1.p1  ORF type:complete len:928 (+),score=194.05 GEMP01010232.1:275-3058(+)